MSEPIIMYGKPVVDKIKQAYLNTYYPDSEYSIEDLEIKEFYVQALQKEPLALINYLVKEIKLYNDKIEITFNTPLRTSPDKQGSSFLSTNKIMTRVQPKQKPIIINMQIKFYI